MGIGQIPPQNVIRLLLCWTMLANKTKKKTHLCVYVHTCLDTMQLGKTHWKSEWEVRFKGGTETNLRFSDLHPSQRPTASKDHPPPPNTELLSILLICHFLLYSSHQHLSPPVPHLLHELYSMFSPINVHLKVQTDLGPTMTAQITCISAANQSESLLSQALTSGWLDAPQFICWYPFVLLCATFQQNNHKIKMQNQTCPIIFDISPPAVF